MAHTNTILERITPIFYVRDLALALEWYQQVLGFDVAWTWGNPPIRASVCRDSAEVNLALPVTEPFTTSRAYISTRGINDYFERISKAGANVSVPIGDRPYGMRDFSLVDPSGNELSFGEPTGP